MVRSVSFSDFWVPPVYPIPVIPPHLHGVSSPVPAACDWSPLPLTPGDPKLWWVTRRAEPPNQTQVPSQTRRRDLAGQAVLIGLVATTPTNTLVYVSPSYSSRSWPGVSFKPSVYPPTLSHYAIPAPVPMPALPSTGWLAPGPKVTRVSHWFLTTVVVCHSLSRVYDFCAICLLVTAPLPASAPSGLCHLTRASPEFPSSLRRAMAVCYCCCVFSF